MSIMLTGPRLLLRDFIPDDWSRAYEWLSRPDAAQFQAWEAHSPEDARGYVARAMADVQDNPRLRFRLTAVLPTDGKLFGASDLKIHGQQDRNGETAMPFSPTTGVRGTPLKRHGSCLKRSSFGTLGATCRSTAS